MSEELQELYKIAPLYRELFDRQLEFVLSPSRFLAAVCSSRAGKTTACAVKAIQELLNKPNSMGLYLALTDKSVPLIFLPVARDLIHKYKLNIKVNNDELIFPNGSVLLLAGADHDKKIESFRGTKLLFCIIDEAASFSTKRLEYLIDQVIGLRLSDLRGQLMLIGTPAAHCSGLFHDVTTNSNEVWDIKRWSAYDNPFQCKQHEESADLYFKRKHCDRTDPGFRREFLGEWCTDDESLMIKPFIVDTPSSIYHQDHWRSVIGVDFGFNDQTAFSVIGWQKNNPKCYVLECFGYSGLSVSEIAQHLKRLKETYKPVSIVGDPAGASKIMMAEFKDKYHIFMDAAQKQNKAHYIEILNDALINGVLLLHPETTKELQKEMKHVVWNEERTREMEGIKCDQLDATLYAYREALGYTEKIKVFVVKTDNQKAEDFMQMQIVKDLEVMEAKKGDSFFSDLSIFMED